MNSFRVARTAFRAARPAFRAPIVQRRGYAEAASDKLKLSLALPHQVRQGTIGMIWRGNSSSSRTAQVARG